MPTQKQLSLSACRFRATALEAVIGALWKARKTRRRSAFTSSATLMRLAEVGSADIKEHSMLLARSNRISASHFSFNFNSYGDRECLELFRFTKQDVVRMIPAIAWPEFQTSTHRNRYSVTPLLATCFVLRRVASPARWGDLEIMFRKHRAHLSEIYWEAMEHMWDEHKEKMNTIDSSHMHQNCSRFAQAVYKKCNALQNCVGFIDGTVIEISRPKGARRQKVVYNGHKRKHALKYQAINTPYGMVMHVHGPVEGRRHDWTLYVRSGVDDILPSVLEQKGTRYCIYGDAGYNRRWYMEVPFQGSNLNCAQRAFNKAMSSSRITVEWIFKEVKLHFTIVDFKRKMKILESPIGLLFLCCMFLSNCRNCIYPNQTSKYFECKPPSLEEYLA